MPHFGTILALRHPLEELGSNGEAAQHQTYNHHTNSGHLTAQSVVLWQAGAAVHVIRAT